MAPDLFFDEGDQPLEATLDSLDGEPGNNVHLRLDPADVLSLGDEHNVLYVVGGAGDSVDAGGGWSVAGQETIDGAVFNVYTQGDVVLKVDCDIDQSLIGLV